MDQDIDRTLYTLVSFKAPKSDLNFSSLKRKRKRRKKMLNNSK